MERRETWHKILHPHTFTRKEMLSYLSESDMLSIWDAGTGNTLVSRWGFILRNESKTMLGTPQLLWRGSARNQSGWAAQNHHREQKQHLALALLHFHCAQGSRCSSVPLHFYLLFKIRQRGEHMTSAMLSLLPSAQWRSVVPQLLASVLLSHSPPFLPYAKGERSREAVAVSAANTLSVSLGKSAEKIIWSLRKCESLQLEGEVLQWVLLPTLNNLKTVSHSWHPASQDSWSEPRFYTQGC